MPYLEDGDMFSMIAPPFLPQRPMDERTAFFHIELILNGLDALHSLGLAHHDMKLENTMLHQDMPVIIDMGMMIKVPVPNPTLAPPVKFAPRNGWPCRCGTPMYFAPEIVDLNKSFDPLAVDMWTVGVMLFIMLVGESFPYDGFVETPAYILVRAL